MYHITLRLLNLLCWWLHALWESMPCAGGYKLSPFGTGICFMVRLEVLVPRLKLATPCDSTHRRLDLCVVLRRAHGGARLMSCAMQDPFLKASIHSHHTTINQWSRIKMKSDTPRARCGWECGVWMQTVVETKNLCLRLQIPRVEFQWTTPKTQRVRFVICGPRCESTNHQIEVVSWDFCFQKFHPRIGYLTTP